MTVQMAPDCFVALWTLCNSSVLASITGALLPVLCHITSTLDTTFSNGLMSGQA